MKKLMATLLLISSVTASAGIYRTVDKENNCTLYYSQDSEYFKEGTTDKRVSVFPAVSFEKYEGQYNLKGLWSLVPLVYNMQIDEKDVDYFMGHSFHSVCVDGKEIITFEEGRKLLNDRNDWDRIRQ